MARLEKNELTSAYQNEVEFNLPVQLLGQRRQSCQGV